MSKLILSGQSRFLKLDASNDPVTGDLTLTPTANSTTTFQVNQADNTVVLNVDTTNARVGIGTDSPVAKLTIDEAVNNAFFRFRRGDDTTKRMDLLIDGTNTFGFTSFDDSTNNYLWTALNANNILFRTGTTSVTQKLLIDHNGNVLVNGFSASTIGLTVKLAAGQSANAFEVQDSGGNILSGADERGILFSDGGTGVENFFAGNNAGRSVATGLYNIVIGHNAGIALSSGASNVILGASAGNRLSTGTGNFALGTSALNRVVSTHNNVAIGNRALVYNIGSGNIGIGSSVLASTGSADFNVSIGYESGRLLTTGDSNIFIGYQAGYRQTSLSNLLIFDNQIRADAATEITNSIIYGVMAATPAAQTLRINAETTVSQDLIVGIADSDKLWFGAGKDMSIFYDGTDGQIVTDDVAASDLIIDCGTEKTLELAEPVYKDINMAGYLLTKPAASAPDVDTFVDEDTADTTIETYAFAVDEKVHGGFELQHDYKEGTNLVFHVHWQGIAAPSGTDNVQWRLTYVIFRDDTTLNAAVTIDSPDTAIAAQYGSYRTDFGAITGTDFLIGDQFMFTLTRVAATGDAYAGDALIETAGIHYQVDTVGSRQVLIK